MLGDWLLFCLSFGESNNWVPLGCVGSHYSQCLWGIDCSSKTRAMEDFALTHTHTHSHLNKLNFIKTLECWNSLYILIQILILWKLVSLWWKYKLNCFCVIVNIIKIYTYQSSWKKQYFLSILSSHGNLLVTPSHVFCFTLIYVLFGQIAGLFLCQYLENECTLQI